MDDPAPLVRYEVAEGVATIAFNRPERLNALNLKTLGQFVDALSAARDDEAVRCLVITGTGRAFCAGADVKDWSEQIEGTLPSEGDDFGELNDRVVLGLYHFPKPVIAAVNGVAVGMGLDIALAADLRLVSRGARFGSRYILIGTVPDFGGSFLLPRLVGLTRATELIMTGRFFDAIEADNLGLVNELAEPDELPAVTDRWARQLASGPSVALGLAKKNLRESLTVSFETSLRNETEAHKICAETEDHKEGVLAMAEKRDPVFHGR